MMPAMGNLSHINYALTCCVGAILAVSGGGAFGLGELGAFLQYSRQVSQPITQISQQVERRSSPPWPVRSGSLR